MTQTNYKIMKYAFPSHFNDGMTLRDYFAGQALAAYQIEYSPR